MNNQDAPLTTILFAHLTRLENQVLHFRIQMCLQALASFIWFLGLAIYKNFPHPPHDGLMILRWILSFVFFVLGVISLWGLFKTKTDLGNEESGSPLGTKSLSEKTGDAVVRDLQTSLENNAAGLQQMLGQEIVVRAGILESARKIRKQGLVVAGILFVLAVIFVFLLALKPMGDGMGPRGHMSGPPGSMMQRPVGP